MMKRVLFCWILAVLVGEGYGQLPYRSLRNYTAIDGLPQSQVQAVAEDENGYLWIGTQGGGLARFDGRNFTVYTTLDGLLTNFVDALRFDPHGNLWVMHPGGVTRYDGMNFRRFIAPRQSRRAHERRFLLLSGDTVFTYASSGERSKIHGDSVYFWNKPVISSGEVVTAHQAPGGEHVLCLSNGDFMVISGQEKYVVKPEKNDRAFNLFNKGADVLVRSPENTYRLDFTGRRLASLSFRVPHFVLCYDEKEDVFWTRDRNTLYAERFDGTRWSTDTLLRSVSVTRVLEDSEGIKWFATDGRGLFKYHSQDFTRRTPDHIRGVMSVFDDGHGNQWLGTMESGLWRISEGEIKSYAAELGVYRNNIHQVKESPDGQLWVATAYGLGRYLPGQDNFEWLLREDGLSHNNVMNIDFDASGGMWLGTLAGVDYFDGKNFKHWTLNDGLNSSTIWSICYMNQNNTLFVGSEFGINLIRDEKVGSLSLPELENATILSLGVFRDSLLLIGSGGSGIGLVDPKTHGKRFFTTHDGLTSDFVYFVAADGDDILWIGTEKGITRLRLNAQLDITENLHFDYENGLTGMETNQNAFFFSNRAKYFGLIDGVYQYNHLGLDDARSFDLHLTDVEVFYGEYPVQDFADSLMGFFKIPYMPVLPADKNHITFHFNRVDKRYPKSVKFRYFLQNFDKTWSKPSSSTHITYGNLPPGKYVFRVMATNNRGSWDGKKISYTFTVKAPFYQTASFIAGVIIFVAGSITLALYLRVRQRVHKMIETERIRMQELESLRKEIARDFHDEMGNQLTRIINYVSLLKLNGEVSRVNGNGHVVHTDHHHDLYKKVEESAKFLYTGTRDFIWSIDPVNDELSKLFIHIRDFGEKLFEEKGISFRAFDEVKESVKLPNGFSREANLIFKEAMTNAFKYSNARNVTLSLKRVSDRFEMVFEDDGVGFAVHQQEKANGLKNIRHRAERIGARLRIRSEIQQGTSVTLDFKLTKKTEYGPSL